MTQLWKKSGNCFKYWFKEIGIQFFFCFLIFKIFNFFFILTNNQQETKINKTNFFNKINAKKKFPLNQFQELLGHFWCLLTPNKVPLINQDKPEHSGSRLEKFSYKIKFF